jgi:hypothetical protein
MFSDFNSIFGLMKNILVFILFCIAFGLVISECQAKSGYYWQKQNGAQSLFSVEKNLVGRLSGEMTENIAIVKEKIVSLDSTTFKITRKYRAGKDIAAARICFDFVHASKSPYWMIPAVSYNGNNFGRGKEPKGASENEQWRTFSFRRTPIPGVTYSEGDRFAVAVWSDNPQTERQHFSCSLMPEEQTTTHRIILPEEEMPTNYYNLNKSKPGFQKNMTLKKGETLTLTLYVNVANTEPNHTAIRHSVDKAWAMREKSEFSIPDADKVWELGIRYATEWLWREKHQDGKTFCGFVSGLNPNNKGDFVPLGDTYQAGWVGRNIAFANALLADFLKTGNAESKHKGLSVLDSWTKHCVYPNGLLITTFGGFPNKSSNNVLDANNLGGSATSLFEAADLAKQVGTDGTNYEQVAYGICNFVKNDQQADGQLARGWYPDGKAYFREGSICACVIPPLITAYQHSKDASYLASAKKGYDFYIGEFKRDGFATAGSLDTWCTDKEGSTALLSSAMMLYEETQERRYLDDALAITNYQSTWLWHYRGIYPEDDDFTKYGYNTFGASSVSVQHNCLDVYALFWVLDWLKLSDITGDPQWREKAIAVWRNSAQLIGDGVQKIHGLTFPAGSQSESFFHCNYWLGHYSHNKENERINGWCPGWPDAVKLEILRKLGKKSEVFYRE